MQRSIAVIALSSAVVVGACSPKEAAKPDSAKVAQTGAPAANTGGSYDPATHVATVKAMDFAFAAPDTIQSGWTTFHLVNEGTTLHHLVVMRVDSGKTITDVAEALKSKAPQKWLSEVGGPNAADPKSQTSGMINMQPGFYVLLCFIDGPDHTPHVAKGMVRPLTVVAGTNASAEPTPDLTMTLADYSFTTDVPLKSGHHTIKVTNKGPQPHEVALIRILPGKKLQDLDTFLYKPEGAPPANSLGGIAGLAPGNSAYFEADVTPGNYALVCFVPDAKDGKPHMLHGMVKEFKVE
jgi:hypothetical protein